MILSAQSVLKERDQQLSARILGAIPFRILDAYKSFNGDFQVLQATVGLKRYENLRKTKTKTGGLPFKEIAETITRATQIRLVA